VNIFKQLAYLTNMSPKSDSFGGLSSVKFAAGSYHIFLVPFFTYCIQRFWNIKSLLLFIYLHINPLPPSDAILKTEKNILEDLFRAVLSQFKKYHSFENLKFNYLGIFQSLKLRILLKKNPLNFS